MPLRGNRNDEKHRVVRGPGAIEPDADLGNGLDADRVR
jgi:hypothetical protein